MTRRKPSVEPAGNILVTGTIRVPSEASNIWIRKYDPDGNWAD